jgi:hypothetical protein
MSSAQIRLQLAGVALLADLYFREAAIRSNDPVYVSGTLLYQQRESSFAPNDLNRSQPASKFTTGFSSNWTAFDSWHTHSEIRPPASLQELQ